MKGKNARYFLTIILSLMFIVVSASQAVAISVRILADEDGLYLKYNLRRWGRDEISLSPGDPETELNLSGIVGSIVRVFIRVDSITDPAEGGIPAVNSIVKVVIPGVVPIEVPVPFYFGDYGLEIKHLRRRLIPMRNFDVEASVLFGLTRTQYAVHIDIPPLLTGAWEGTATLLNNEIDEEVMIGEERRLAIHIMPIKTIPFTLVHFTVDIYEGDELVQPIKATIPVPNGCYHVYLNPGFDLQELLPFALQ